MGTASEKKPNGYVSHDLRLLERQSSQVRSLLTM